MKAIVYTQYGSPDVLELQDVVKPIPKDEEVLVQVRAASINSWDWDMVRGEPFMIRMWGLFKPKYTIPGADIAGIVEAAGKKVTRFKPGDKVFGDLNVCGWGGFAEYVCVSEKALAHKSSEMTFEQAAAIPQAGVIAFQSIVDYGQVQAGQKVLINGAGGGVGTFAIQIAKSLGALVTGVDSTEKQDIMLSCGADQVLDYTKTDFTQIGKRFDFILDNVTLHSITVVKRILNPDGIYVMVGGATSRMFQAMLLSPLQSGERKFKVFTARANENLDDLVEWFDTGRIKPVIDKVYTLDDVPEAFRYFVSGETKGKIVISI